MKIAVVGAGVIGLSCALCTVERYPDHDVVIIADDYSPNTTADKAGALIMPSLSGEDVERSKGWFIDTFWRFIELSSSVEVKNTGISLSFGYWSVEGVSNATWLKDTVFGLRKVPEWERKLQRLPEDGKWWSLGTFVVDSSIYLPFLLKKFLSKGGRTIDRSLSNLDELSEDYDIVINCSGLGAKELASDGTIYPAWGQGKLVEAPWIKHFINDSMPKMYGANAVTFTDIFPRSTGVYIGSVLFSGVRNKSYDPVISAQLSHKAQQVMPSLKHAPVLKEWTGVRPMRDTVRLELDEPKYNVQLSAGDKQQKRYIIHNYGHGGRGISLSWGCALEVVELIGDIVKLNGEQFTQGRPSMGIKSKL